MRNKAPSRRPQHALLQGICPQRRKGPVLAGLILGKPIGIFLLGWLAAKPLGLGLPAGMRIVDLVVVGFVAAIGFTVALFIAAVAFEPGPVQDAAKMGALFSFGAAALAIAAGKLFRVEKQKD